MNIAQPCWSLGLKCASRAAVALPAYKDYVDKAKVATAIGQVNGDKLKAEENWVVNAVNGGNITGTANGVTVTLTGSYNADGTVGWTCTNTLISVKDCLKP